MTIQKFSNGQLLSIQLEKRSGPIAGPAEAVRSSRTLTMPGREQAQFGVWEASVGTFTRDVVAGEIMAILSGEAAFISESGERWEMEAGDTLVFPPNTRGKWEIMAPMRKLYVLL